MMLGDEVIALKWGNLSAAALCDRQPRPADDSWIAACCLSYGIPLATFNVKDFQYYASSHGLVLLTDTQAHSLPSSSVARSRSRWLSPHPFKPTRRCGDLLWSPLTEAQTGTTATETATGQQKGGNPYYRVTALYSGDGGI